MNELSVMIQTPIAARVTALSLAYSRLDAWREQRARLSVREAADMAAEALAFLTPAQDSEIAVLIERLRANYPEFDDLPETVLELTVEDLINDLEGFPATLLHEACKRWRNSEARRAPTAGQLKALVAKELRAAERVAELAANAMTMLARAEA